ncbi:cytochrome P450 [Stachybotrys elegans]|uniref:Cytochrome P450 n=1 Tax=Stachybotrys elegans TaxID=80388 RepID=A0A8K0T9E7_9HYPO|nr:cytochrome P450 [Stachybotrys elegans]
MTAILLNYTGTSICSFFCMVIAICTCYLVAHIAYNIFLHPLASYPGPISHRISIFPRTFQEVRGQLPFHVAKLHLKYGPVVRIAPNELAFCDVEAWKDIYGHRQQGEEEFPKYDGFYRPNQSTPSTILSCSREEHTFFRRQLSHGFSDRSMRAQEPIIQGYVNLLIARLKEQAEGGRKMVDMREWLNWTTFDIIGDLAMGNSFGCLEKSDYHPWVKLISRSITATSYFQSFAAIFGRDAFTRIVNSGLWRSRSNHRDLIEANVMRRMQLGSERLDLIEGLLKKQEDTNMSVRQISLNASRLIVAGSETTATLLSGAIFLLLTNREKLARLVNEVRSAFANTEEISLSTVNELPYMLACLNETLRMYPPVATGFPRQVPQQGGIIAGNVVPSGTVVSVFQWAINHDPRFWTEPSKFKPGRFMGEAGHEDDRLDAMQPFSTGPRNCIGKNLAYAEMRLILAKIIYSFDMHLADDTQDWIASQKCHSMWVKPPLEVYLVPAKV